MPKYLYRPPKKRGRGKGKEKEKGAVTRPKQALLRGAKKICQAPQFAEKLRRRTLSNNFKLAMGFTFEKVGKLEVWDYEAKDFVKAKAKGLFVFQQFFQNELEV